MEAILGSGNNERLITRELVGLGLRGIYGGAMDLFDHLIPPANDDGGSAARDGADAAVHDDGAASSKSDKKQSPPPSQLAVTNLEIQANIYKMCVHRTGERRTLQALCKLSQDSAALDRWKTRLDELDREDAMLLGARVCLAAGCNVMESADRKFELCGRCKIAAYCSRECQRADWRCHSKYCIEANT